MNILFVWNCLQTNDYGKYFIETYRVSQKNFSTFHKILENKDNMNRLKER